MNQRIAVSRIAIVIALIVVIVVAAVGLYYVYGNQSKTPASKFKVAEIIPGYVNDQSYAEAGYQALMALNKTEHVQVAYTENILSPTAAFQTAVQQYISEGYNIIYLHGSQFASAVGIAPNSTGLSSQYPNVEFIVEADTAGQIPVAKNVWVIDRNFAPGFYVFGALAALVTNSDKVGFISGQQLPFSNAEVNAAIIAMKTINPNLQFYRQWVGDFTDPVKTGTAARTMIGLGVDVILSDQNLGNPGLFQAVQGTNVLVAVKYTDQSSQAPSNYLTSYLYNFTPPLIYVYNQIASGHLSGYYRIPFSPTGGAYIQLPIMNVNQAVQTRIRGIIDGIVNGSIQVPWNTTNPGNGPSL
jgi:basic membrane protein A